MGRNYNACRADYRPTPYRGYNIDFIASYLSRHPGARSGEAIDALAKSRGYEKRPNHGWNCWYFSNSWVVSSPTANRLWRRIPRPDGGVGWTLTLQGMGRVKHDLAG